MKFEIIDRNGGRHRFMGDEYWWAWRPKSGTADEDDFKIVDVFKKRTEEETLALEDADEGFDSGAPTFSFPYPARVGNVSEDTCLTMPFSELQMEQCPRCGYIAKPN